MTFAHALIALIVTLQAADVATTAWGLSHGLAEANPVVSKLFGRLSPLGMIAAAVLLKLAGTAPMIALAWFYPAWWPVPAFYAATLAWVVRHNLKAISQA